MRANRPATERAQYAKNFAIHFTITPIDHAPAPTRFKFPFSITPQSLSRPGQKLWRVAAYQGENRIVTLTIYPGRTHLLLLLADSKGPEVDAKMVDGTWDFEAINTK